MYRHLLRGHGIHNPLVLLTRHRTTGRLALSSYGILTSTIPSRHITMDIDQVSQGMKRTIDDVAGQDESKKMKLGETSEDDAHAATMVEKEVSGAEDVAGQNPSTQPDAGPSKSSGTKQQPKSKKQKKFEKRADRKERRRATLRPDGEERAESSGPRLPKRQCALLVGYSGAGYNGMQIQYTANVKTIEGTLFNALVKAGAVSQDNSDDPVKVNLGRAARTDAGVHAAGNLISMKLITEVPGVPDLVARINEELPPEIRLWSFLRVQNSFNARGLCDSRKYTYFFPSYLLIPPKPESGLHKTFLSKAPEGYTIEVHPFWKDTSPDSSPSDDMRRKREWRVGKETLEQLREIAQRFIGSHNFHNYTVGASYQDASSRRVMKEIEITDPMVYGDTEWIAVLLHGQSFMFHQIRKMIAALILIARTGTPPEVMTELYSNRTLFVPRMPALGLLLEYPLFGSYNKKTESLRDGRTPEHPEYRPPIDFEIHRADIDKFKQDFIYSGMRNVEDREGVFDAWVRTVDAYSGGDLLWLNPTGSIPEEAIIHLGTKRPQPFRERKRFDATSFPETGGEKMAGCCG
ncbi:hypothetical protein QCA50_010514 [Cerrena zonata]|uniref:Pseudouridine synthase I TruA alpha/beta domain-containing protein n=1 Tax=Cerrena zonata TaxID=2478898 RepID=A0AAW0GB43_9APHY